MGPIGVLLGVVAFAGLALSIRTWRTHPDATGLSLAQAAVWFVGVPLMECYLTVSPEVAVRIWPPVDLALACVVAYAWITRRHGYTLAYLGFLVLQVGLHVTYVAQPTDGSLMNQYKLLLNVTFCAQSVCGAWPGLKDVVARAIDILRSRDHGHLPVGHSG